jgi:hypothetical protein
MLKISRFEELTAAYGADLERWPEELRSEAQALLAVSDRARAALAEARTLDEAIKAARARDDARTWKLGEHHAALARLRAGVAARVEIPTGSAARALLRYKSSKTSGGNARRSHLRWVGIAALCTAAVVCGVLIGARYAPPARSASLFSVLQLPLTYLQTNEDL